MQNTIQFIDNKLGAGGDRAQYNYLDILLSRIYTAFCGFKVPIISG